ncbi:pseudaminic acid cytidylyltransferase [Salinivibrio sp. YCSC6]|uniref:pseudaminic acid cytidylyltransferase n=1 Tax=Salinivibrio sp. YCSC6 TaxID=2003370 RepID=UPI000BBB80BF|nr:pseudaminic acid cytidylyltransferase [Salinivibrio sp. YCSC6]PCE67641.1 pseudaminic acid cytidylyltransferase [Salinivibrio sp. YCSC6]QCF35459.1 pseudaminic acid cytidylyltransferase [Salinivibrio sp. YCSC6]
MNIAIIPARGGSKRIPRKNIKAFHGKPMIAYSIEAAIASDCFDKVIVSTDDQDIADVAMQYGAEVPFLRPADISDDHATTMDVIQHAIEWYETQGVSIDKLCCIYATAPFVSSHDIQLGLYLVDTEGVEFAFSATTFAFPIQRAITVEKNGEVNMLQLEHLQSRSQDLVETYHDAGQFYWGKVDAFKQGLSMFAPHSRIVKIPRYRAQDIDTVEDWHVAELLYQILTEKTNENSI